MKQPSLEVESSHQLLPKKIQVCRVLRAAKKKGYRLSLSVNTDFKGALQALRDHHEDLTNIRPVFF